MGSTEKHGAQPPGARLVILEHGGPGKVGQKGRWSQDSPIPLFTHPQKQSPQGTDWPLPWERSQSVRIIASRVNDGEWTGPVYLTNWKVA